MSLRRLHRAFVESVRKDHWIKVQNAERKPWLRAERDALHDLEVIVNACDTSAEASSEDDASLPADVIDEAFRERFTAAVTATSEPRARELAKATHVAPWNAGRVDIAAIEPWLDALFSSLRYSDGDGDESFIPEQGEALLEFDEQGRAARRPAPPMPDWARARHARKSRVELRPYRADAAFAVGDWIQHKTFGEGLVLEAREKLRVLFESGVRMLVHVLKT